MTVLVFGKTGQVARELAGLPGVICLGREDANLTAPESCSAAIHAHVPSAVINAAAYTAVDKAETEEALATLVNADAPAVMARACASLKIPLVQISTDYVFDGSGTLPWRPEQTTSPLGAYGRSKLKGEQSVGLSGSAYAILRTSWVVSAHGNNFVKTMLRVGAERDELTVVADQVGGPTAARDIARACLDIAKQLSEDATKSGVYHFSGAPDCSWADFARSIFAQSTTDCSVRDIPSDEYPTPAARPLNSRLDCTSTHRVFGIERPDWKVSVADILQELGASK